MDEKDNEEGGTPPWFVKADRGAKKVSTEYSRAQRDEMAAIRSLFTKICWPQEKAHTLNTLDIKHIKKQNTEEPKVPQFEFPLFFRVDANHRPEFLMRGFSPVRDPNHWISFVGKKTPIPTSIKIALGYLCAAQFSEEEEKEARTPTKTPTKKSVSIPVINYDPPNMFFEELKSWLIVLSMHPIFSPDKVKAKTAVVKNVSGREQAEVLLSDQEAMQDSSRSSSLSKIEIIEEANATIVTIVEDRYQFISEVLLSESIFSSKESQVFVSALNKVRAVFKDDIIPSLKLSLAHNEIKRKFDEFKINLQRGLRSALTFLFYVFREGELLTEKLDVELLREVYERQHESADSTTLGRLALHLVNTDVMKHILPSSVSDGSAVDPRPPKFFCQNSFLNDFGSGVLPSGVLGPKCSFGALACFEEDTETMNKLYKCYGLIQRLALFCAIFEELCRLRENLFRDALGDMREVIQTYKQLHTEVLATLNSLVEKGFSQVKIKGAPLWKKCFRHVCDKYPHLLDTLKMCHAQVHELEEMLCNIPASPSNGPVKVALETFSLLSGYFTGKLKSYDVLPQSLNNREQLLSHKSSSQPSIPATYSSSESPVRSFSFTPQSDEGK
ncbi:MAG TPA: hypothetical protein VGV92_04045 [Gammaproteobacteria bacterium]|nr:hypothetical protein [Gammaproteobacteria bacterium]